MSAGFPYTPPLGETKARADELPELCLKLLALIVGAAVVVENSIHTLFYQRAHFLLTITHRHSHMLRAALKRKLLCISCLRRHSLRCDVQLFDVF